MYVHSYGYNEEDSLPPFVSTPFLPGRRHSSGSEAPPKGSTPVKLIRAAAAVGGQKKSCFDLAENRAADSLWVGAHRYTRIKFASKLLWV